MFIDHELPVNSLTRLTAPRTRSKVRGWLGMVSLAGWGALGCRGSSQGFEAAQPRAHDADAAAAPSMADARTSLPADDAVSSSPAGTKVTLEERAMGTKVVLSAFTTVDRTEPDVRRSLLQAFEGIRALESRMTTWRPDSEVSRINAAAGVGKVRASDDTREVIAKSLWASRVSGGAFDITFASMGSLWKFDSDLDPHPPSREAVERARELIDYRQVLVDDDAKTVFLARSTTRISLGGIAKGYAIDRAAAVLIAAGVNDFVAQAGGDLYVHGAKPDGSSWIVGIRDPRGAEGDYFAAMEVRDHAFSTAGDYERAYVLGGRRYHHIIDPKTGFPAQLSRSVTLWAPDALTADALDDAVFILGPKKGLELVESIEGCGAVIVDATNRVWVSKRLQGKVQLQRAPTSGL